MLVNQLDLEVIPTHPAILQMDSWEFEQRLATGRFVEGVLCFIVIFFLDPRTDRSALLRTLPTAGLADRTGPEVH